MTQTQLHVQTAAVLADLQASMPPQTPALVLHRGALERNLGRMQAACAAAGVKLRAHGKTHKCSALGRLQVARGAVGLCAQTVGEAEAFVAGGIANVLVTAPVPPWGAARLARLQAGSPGVRVSVVADGAEQIERLGAAPRAAGVELGLVVDVDLGQHRSGAYPEQALTLARLAADTPGLSYRGVQAYLGHLQHLDDVDRRREADRDALGRLAGLIEQLRGAGLAPEIVTGGGTGTHTVDLASGVFTELQAGSYAVMDVEYDACGSPDREGTGPETAGGGGWAFEPAMAIAASVVSTVHKTHVVVDAGLKAVSVDGPPARVLAGAAEGSIWRPMGDEHGAIFHPTALPLLRAAGRDPLAFAEAVARADADPEHARPSDAPKPGGTVWLQPGHCDPTVNLYDAFLVLEPDGRFTRWPIDARRTTPAAETA